MSFANIQKFSSGQQTFRRIQYLDLKTNALIRILDETAVSVAIHYINGTYIKCLGDECPVCDDNHKLAVSNPKDFRQAPGYFGKSYRYYVNVLDKTPTKVCPGCGAEIRNPALSQCPSCNEIIVTVPLTPLNKVKVLAKGSTLFESLNAIESSMLDSEGNKIGLQNFDILLAVSGTGKKATVTVIPNLAANAPVTYDKEELYDLSNPAIVLTADEIRDFKRGVSLKDIFAGRKLSKASEQLDAEIAQAVSPVNEVSKDAYAKAMELFSLD